MQPFLEQAMIQLTSSYDGSNHSIEVERESCDGWIGREYCKDGTTLQPIACVYPKSLFRIQNEHQQSSRRPRQTRRQV
jgi:hypothetical protein